MKNAIRLSRGVILGVLPALCLVAPLPVAGQTESPPVPAAGADAAPAAGQAQGDPGSGKKILDMDIGELAKTPVTTSSPSSSVAPSMDTPVTSVSKQESTIGHSPAAVFVITNDMIRRSGARTVAEALRMAPGLDVAQINQNEWSVGSRGFNRRYANKLLVLVDGRTVYTPTYSGVYWDTVDVLLEDIDRIEVIRGPGGTLWGANAVNGVISIITKKAKDTQGVYGMVGTGTEERTTDAMRYGGQLGEDGHYRVYGKHFERGTGWAPDGADDAWRQGRGGFRADWNLDRDKSNTLTVQGDSYVGDSGQRDWFNTTLPPFVQTFSMKDRVSGENVLMRFRHTYDEDSDYALQMYYDRYERDNRLYFEQVKTLDLDFQYRFPLTQRQRIIWGAGFRHLDDNLIGGDPFTLSFNPERRGRNLVSGFLQDEITLVEDRLTLTLGTKLDDNDFTGLEVEPSARLLWTPDKRHSAWGAVSRAVRTPSRVEEDVTITQPLSATAPVFYRGVGSHTFASEDMMAYEIGYREQTTDRFSWDLALFYNVYENLRTADAGTPYLEFSPPPPHLIVPGTFANGGSAEAYGLELSGTWTLTERWRLYSYYAFLQLHEHEATEDEGISPINQVYLRSAWDIGRNIQFDLMARYVDRLSGGSLITSVMEVPSYITMDVRLGWRPRKHLELAVVGQNLLQDHHAEFPNDFHAVATEVPRGVYGTATWRF